VFSSRPQHVEFYSSGRWLPGSLLGWRHAADGSCQVWVRPTGTGTDAWTDLENVRLPQASLAAGPAPARAAECSAEPAPVPSEADAVSTARHGDDLAATRSLRLVEVAGTGAARRGRPSAPGVLRPPASRGSAPRGIPALRDDAASRASHPAGRRRADSRVVGETAEMPAIGSAAGRHRAPAAAAEAGRHRAADTGVLPSAGVETVALRTPTARAAAAWGTTRAEALGVEPDRLTRPMRLGDLAPARDPRRGHPADGT